MAEARAAISNNLDRYTFTIALVVIVGFLLYYGIVLFFDRGTGYDGLKTVSATLGNIVAAIIGYYFGQRPVRRLALDAENAASERDIFRQNSVDNLDTAESKAQEIEDYSTQMNNMVQQINDMRTVIENLKRKGG